MVGLSYPHYTLLYPTVRAKRTFGDGTDRVTGSTLKPIRFITKELYMVQKIQKGFLLEFYTSAGRAHHQTFDTFWTASSPSQNYQLFFLSIIIQLTR